MWKNLQFSITNRSSLIPLRPENSFIFFSRIPPHNCILINNFSSVVCLHNLKMFIQFHFSISLSALHRKHNKHSEHRVLRLTAN